MIIDLWCKHKASSCPQLKYLATVLELELCMLVFVRSQREANFNMYIDALTEISPWFFALDHTNYARWIPVHSSDMLNLTNKHPDVTIPFAKGMFTVQKTNHVFSCIATDHTHKQRNAIIKGDGRVVGIIDNPSALHRWMIAGPEDVLATSGPNGLCTSTRIDVTSLDPCIHEEADTQLLLHASKTCIRK